MENYQKLEQLVNKTGCSYEDGKAALEGCGWDMIDAVINLERDGKINKETAVKKDAATESIPEITAEVISTGSSRQNTYGNAGDEEKAGSSSKSSDARGTAGKRGLGRLWDRIKRIVMNNRMVVINSSGQKVTDLPILVPVIALMCFFWLTLGLAVVAMVFGWRFHFEGEDLGKTNINNTMDKATDYAEKVRTDLAGKAKDGQNTDC